MTQTASYIGRYAPSPTGPLHFGSLVAATASYLDAKAHDGKWLLRMEDLDSTREMPGAADDILSTLDHYGFEWDGEVLFQSQRSEAYQAAIGRLKQQQRVYACSCSRREVAAIAHAGIEGPVYPGTCRRQQPQQREALAWRLKVDTEQLSFRDLIQGSFIHHLKRDIGDFVIQRADGIYAYQLAVVVDDNEQGITHVVRGADLLNSTSRQILLQLELAMRTPIYAHLPLVTNAQGEKLSKQTHAMPISLKNAGQQLLSAFRFLGMPANELSQHDSLHTIWQWAIKHWNIARVPAQTTFFQL